MNSLIRKNILLSKKSIQCLSYSTKFQCISSKLNFVNNQRQDGHGNERIPFFNPATAEQIGYINNCNETDANEVINCAIQAQKEWSKLSFTTKSKILLQTADLIRDDCDYLSYLDTIDSGKPLWQSAMTIMECADSLQMFAGFISTLRGSHVILPNDDFFYTRTEPLGVCVGIGSWNYPFQMSVWKSAPALAAGNSFIFKPSPETPQSAVRLGELYKKAGLPPGVYNVIQGTGQNCAEYLCENSSVHKISFTGSSSTGRKVMQSAATNGLRHVTLELGGKSPLVIFDDADLNQAVLGTLMANFYSQGQVCSNAARVFVQSSIMKPFIEQLLSLMARFRLGDPLLDDVDMGPIIHKAHGEKILNYIQSARKEGAQLLFGSGNRMKMLDAKLNNGFFIQPTLLTNCHDEMVAVKEEIFGPVITLLTFDNEEEVIQRCNNTEYGLSGGVFTQNLTRAHRFAGALHCGSVYINTFNLTPPGFPFGGYKSSGIGRENALETLAHFTQLKSVFVKGAPHEKEELLFPSLLRQ